jgi:MFS family permease
MDPLGFSLLTVGVSTLTIGLMHTIDWGWTSPYTLLCFAISVVGLYWFYRSENKCPYPIIPFTAFTNRTFFCCSVILFCVFFIITSMFFLIPLYLQLVLDKPAYIAGLMLLPITGVVALLSPVVGHLVDKVSSRMLILVGLGLFTLSALIQANFHRDTSTLLVLIALFSMGLGWAFGRNPATTKGITALPPHLSGAATGMIWTIQNVGSTTGLALTGTIFRKYYEPAMTHATFLAGYRWAMLLLFGIGVACILFTVFSRKREV